MVMPLISVTHDREEASNIFAFDDIWKEEYQPKYFNGRWHKGGPKDFIITAGAKLLKPSVVQRFVKYSDTI